MTAAARPLLREFYARDSLHLAPLLLGKLLVRLHEGERLSGVIVEVEAYAGAADQGSHAFSGQTRRNASMFDQGGRAYVYLTYGIHHCLNVVAGREGEAGGVLLRALRPVEGLEAMAAARGRGGLDLTSGPGRLTQALRVDRALDGHDLTLGQELWLEEGVAVPPKIIVTGPRVGLGQVGEAVHYPWRFALRGEPHVSRPRPPGWALPG